MRFPDHLPLQLSVLTGLGTAIVTVLPAIAIRGLDPHPSSTSGIAYVVGPIAALLMAGVGLAVGLGVRAVVRRSGTTSRPVPAVVTAVVVLGLVAAAVAQTSSVRSAAKARIEAARPRILVPSPVIAASDLAPAEPIRESTLLFTRAGIAPAAGSIGWNGRSVSIRVDDDYVTIRDEAGTTLAAIDTRDYDYVSVVHAVPFCGAADRQDLAVLMALRPTSRRSLFTVVAPDGSIRYQELVERAQGVSGRGLSLGQLDGRQAIGLELGRTTSRVCVS